MQPNAKRVKISKEPDDKVNAQETLRDSQRFLRTLISNLPGYVYRCQAIDGIWCTQFASEGIYELTGYHTSEFLKDGGISYSRLVHPDDRPIVKNEVIEALNSKRPYQITYRIATADSKEKWVWEQGRGIYDGTGEIIATEGFITDITEKKLAEEEIIKRNEELSTLNLTGQSLSKLAKPSEILDLIYQMAGRLLDNRNFYVALYDTDTGQISFPIYTIDGKVSRRKSRKFADGLTEYVIQTKKPLLIESNMENVMNKLGIRMIGEKSKSFLAVPMMVGDNLIGVIALQDYEKEYAFNKSQVELVSTMASQAAIALENSNLYGQLHKELHKKKAAEKKLKTSLQVKDVLLQEVHHRVKNNLQIMSSLLRLQSSYVKTKESAELFRESGNRIKSMAIIHNKLYNSKNYEKVDFGDYVTTLTDNLFLSFGISKQDINLRLDIDNIKLNIDTAIPCGLIINELVSNTFKYAFPDGRKGHLSISLSTRQDDDYTLTLQDNGAGLPEGFDFQSNKSLGMKLVHLLTDQLGGTIQFESNHGMKYIINFSEVTYKERGDINRNDENAL